jgi:flagellar P-ring protein precursor FlgI
MTPLKGADDNVYALAQGPLLVGGFSSSGNAGGGVQKNHPTVARIPNGASIESEIAFDFNSLEHLTIALDTADFTTARRVSEAIENRMENVNAYPLDAGTIKIEVPSEYRNSMVNLVASLEQIDVQPDMEAKIILSERTGTVVMGENVRIAAIAIAHGNLSVQIKESANVSQPNPFSEGDTAVVPDSQVTVTEDDNRLLIVQPEGASLGDVVKALNAIGVSPRDLITVFQAIKAGGALQAQLEII